MHGLTAGWVFGWNLLLPLHYLLYGSCGECIDWPLVEFLFGWTFLLSLRHYSIPLIVLEFMDSELIGCWLSAVSASWFFRWMHGLTTGWSLSEWTSLLIGMSWLYLLCGSWGKCIDWLHSNLCQSEPFRWLWGISSMIFKTRQNSLFKTSPLGSRTCFCASIFTGFRVRWLSGSLIWSG